MYEAIISLTLQQTDKKLSIKKNLVFYVITGLPAYVLIFYGLKGLGYLPVTYGNSSYYNPSAQSFDTYGFLTTFMPTSNIAPFFIIVGFGIIGLMGLRAYMKYRDG